MARRVFVERLNVGRCELSAGALHHLVGVLRLTEGTEVEGFDASGNIGKGSLSLLEGGYLDVREVTPPPLRRALTVASAVPKGDRADYLVEKLAELGVARFVPLRTARSVVHPTGVSKLERWVRIAQEATRQSRGAGVMEVSELVELGKLEVGVGSWFCSTGVGAGDVGGERPGLVIVGPEGGFTEEEEGEMARRGAVGVSLGRTVLRTETACVVAAAFALGG